MQIQDIFKKYGQKRVEYLQDHFCCFSRDELIEMLLEEMNDRQIAGYMQNVDELIDEDEEYNEFGVNTKNSFNTQPEE